MPHFGSVDDERRALEAALRPLLTPAFLATLVQAVRVGGVDAVDDIYEVEQFAQWCHALAGQPCPELYTCCTSAFDQEPPLSRAPSPGV